MRRSGACMIEHAGARQSTRHPSGKHPIRRCLTFMLAGVLCALMSGCGPMQVRGGTKPAVEVLNTSLQVDRSTPEAVQAALGTPDGRGRSMLPWQSAPRTVWCYHYEEDVIDVGGPNSDARRIFLFVFFNGEFFDGYMWFSSLKPSLDRRAHTGHPTQTTLTDLEAAARIRRDADNK